MSRVGLAVFTAFSGCYPFRLLGFVAFYAELVGPKTVSPAIADLALQVLTAGRRGAHWSRADVPNALLTPGAAGKPIGNIWQEWLPNADRSGHRPRAGRALLLRQKPAADTCTRPSGGNAPTCCTTGQATAKLKHRRTALNSGRQSAPVQPTPQSVESPVPTSAQQQ
jgi:hypothetical protein